MFSSRPPADFLPIKSYSTRDRRKFTEGARENLIIVLQHDKKKAKKQVEATHMLLADTSFPALRMQLLKVNALFLRLRSVGLASTS